MLTVCQRLILMYAAYLSTSANPLTWLITLYTTYQAEQASSPCQPRKLANKSRFLTGRNHTTKTEAGCQ